MNVKKICLYGTESTGKTTLAMTLANHYNTEYVPEIARDIITDTENCTMADLVKVAELHAEEIEKRRKNASRFLFIDTDLLTTRSYGKFLFDQTIEVPLWVEEANTMDLYLYLDNDVPFIQDGSRLTENKRNELNLFHFQELQSHNFQFEFISGTWHERFIKAIMTLEEKFPITSDK